MADRPVSQWYGLANGRMSLDEYADRFQRALTAVHSVLDTATDVTVKYTTQLDRSAGEVLGKHLVTAIDIYNISGTLEGRVNFLGTPEVHNFGGPDGVMQKYCSKINHALEVEGLTDK